MPNAHHLPNHFSYIIILIDEGDIPNPAPIIRDKLAITGRALIA